jgi:hypothetical protein
LIRFKRFHFSKQTGGRKCRLFFAPEKKAETEKWKIGKYAKKDRKDRQWLGQEQSAIKKHAKKQKKNEKAFKNLSKTKSSFAG